MARVKFANSRLVSEKKNEVWERIFQVAGTNKSVDIAQALDRGESEIGNWRGARDIPLEFIVDFCIKFSVSIDYVLLGKGEWQSATFTGDPFVSFSHGTQQIAGSNFGAGANILHSIGERVIKPEMERLISVLDHYGSPALYAKIEKFILELHGDSYPVNLPKT